MLADVWFLLVAFTLCAYVVLDGFDLGVGILHLWVARSDAERRAVLRSIGPVWDGNEVWLVASGATVLLAFPRLFAATFSGFYLPLIVVLWLLLFRALGIELRHQLAHPLWQQFWDVAFSLASLVLTVFFGAALGNVVRGVVLDDEGQFFAPLWTNFNVDPLPGILDWYTLTIAATAACAVTQHGALWLLLRCDGTLADRAERALRWAHRATVLMTASAAPATLLVQRQMSRNLEAHPGWVAAPLAVAASLAALWAFRRRRAFRAAFLTSAAYLVAMLLCAYSAIYPYALPPRGDSGGLLLREVAAPASSLSIALYWWLPGMALVIGYFVIAYRNLPDVGSADRAPAEDAPASE